MLKKKNKMIRKIHGLILTIGLFIIVGCGDQMPDEVIPPAQMENILYDYHLSLGMSTNLNYTDNYMKTSYMNYIYKKHNITEAEFDSSMVWYTRHTGELAAIYTNLSERFRKEKQHVTMFLEARQEGEFVSMPGDTVSVWPYRTLYWLTSTPLNNMFTFELTADSNFHSKDAFLWKANYTFLAEGQATMALNVMFDNDSVIGQSKQIVSSGMDSIYLHSDSAYNIRKVHGFIYLKADSSQIASLLVNDLSMTKYHMEKDSVEVSQDSIPTTQVREPKIHSEKLKEIAPDEKIRLQ